jgi:homoserine O-succinyltransferase
MTLDVQHPSAGPGHVKAPAGAGPRAGARGEPALAIGLINNMPDAALVATETQFTSLLEAASGGMRLEVRFFALPEVLRSADARARIAARYYPLDALYSEPPDAVIVTGTEPRSADLRDEAYWSRMVEVIEFARSVPVASIWSCLAAHAAVLHLDGIVRRRLPAKLCGVFDHQVSADEPLTAGIGTPLRTPHSRWNDLPVGALESAGYTVISRSTVTGADAFTKYDDHPMLFLQGHPEYEARTLLKEFQRDVVRFISGEYQSFPELPGGYFSPGARELLSGFRRRLLAGELAEPQAAFPFAALAASCEASWRAPAVRLYANWLGLVASRVGRAAPMNRGKTGTRGAQPADEAT